jgi:hypothetical protein
MADVVVAEMIYEGPLFQPLTLPRFRTNPFKFNMIREFYGGDGGIRTLDTL